MCKDFHVNINISINISFTQDYLGAIIVFIAILTALITSYLLPNEASPSLVAMALQYTLLIPIYLNWVVQLSANMEMYFGACERISYCIENGNQEAESAGKTMEACKYSLTYRLSRISLQFITFSR